MSAQGASGGFVITSGTFTADARKYVHGLNIELIDGIALQHLFAQAKSAIPAEMAVDKASSSAPRCPACGNPMVKRIARQGKHAGESFWGCSAYPKCKTILPFSTTVRTTNTSTCGKTRRTTHYCATGSPALVPRW